MNNSDHAKNPPRPFKTGDVVALRDIPPGEDQPRDLACYVPDGRSAVMVLVDDPYTIFRLDREKLAELRPLARDATFGPENADQISGVLSERARDTEVEVVSGKFRSGAYAIAFRKGLDTPVDEKIFAIAHGPEAQQALVEAAEGHNHSLRSAVASSPDRAPSTPRPRSPGM